MTREMVRGLNALARVAEWLADLFEDVGLRLRRCPNCGRSVWNGRPCVGEEDG